MAHFAEINQAPSPYSMLQHIGRVATLKLVPRNWLKYLQTTMLSILEEWQLWSLYQETGSGTLPATLIGDGEWSQNSCEVVSKKISEKERRVWKNLTLFFSLKSLFLMFEICQMDLGLIAGADPEILKRGDTLCRPPWLTDEESFRFEMV